MPPQTAAHLAHGRALEALNVAIVDERRGMAKLLCSMLNTFGVHRLRTFDDPAKALQQMHAQVPDMVLVNSNAEVSRGCRLVRALRQVELAPLCFAAVILLTNCARRGEIEEALRAGAHQVLIVPLAPATLQQRVEWLIADRRAMVLDGARYAVEGIDTVLDAIAKPRREPLHTRERLVESEEAPRPPEATATAQTADEGEQVWEI